MFSLNPDYVAARSLRSLRSNYRRVHVQTTINYFNETGDFVDDAAVTWTEKIYAGGFNACVLKAGRLERQTPDNGLTFVDFVAYQGAPEGGMEHIAEASIFLRYGNRTVSA